MSALYPGEDICEKNAEWSFCKGEHRQAMWTTRPPAAAESGAASGSLHGSSRGEFSVCNVRALNYCLASASLLALQLSRC